MSGRPVSIPLIYAAAYTAIGFGLFASRHLYAVLVESFWEEARAVARARQRPIT